MNFGTVNLMAAVLLQFFYANFGLKLLEAQLRKR